MTTTFTFGPESRLRLIGLHPDLVKLATAALRFSAVDFRIQQGLRTAKQQLAYYKAGASLIKSGGRHQFGCAVDVMAWLDTDGDGTMEGSWKTSTGLYLRIKEGWSKASQQTGIPFRWGGTFQRLKDYGHFELPKGQYPDNWKR